MVHPLHRRRGYASALLNSAAAELTDAGLTPCLDVALANTEARSLYAHLGWREIGASSVTTQRRIPVAVLIYSPLPEEWVSS